MILSGVLSIVFGDHFILPPATDILSPVWLIGLRAILSGALLIALAVQLRRAGEELSGNMAAR